MCAIVFFLELHIKLLLLPNVFESMGEWGEIVNLGLAVLLGPLSFFQVSRFYTRKNELGRSIYFGLVYIINTIATYIIVLTCTSLGVMLAVTAGYLAVSFMVIVFIRSSANRAIRKINAYA